MEDGSYIEQLGYEGKRNAPPWQSAIRTISEDAYDCIIKRAGDLILMPTEKPEELREHLKTAIREYFLSNDRSAIIRVAALAAKLTEA